MYKYTSPQISFEDFGQPLGMKMNPGNRWIKKAQYIPWEEIEEKYAKLFANEKGNVAKPLRLALGACIIQSEYGYSDEETVLQIQEGPYLQYFCGLKQYQDQSPFDPSLMVHFRKRLTPEILGEINELIIQKAQKSNSKSKSDDENKNGDDDNDDLSNRGTMILDATCAPSNIKYPTDTALLNEAREKSEALIDQLHQPGKGEKPRTYRRIARKKYKKFVRARKPSQKKIRQCIRQQLGYLGRNLRTIEKMLENKEPLPNRLARKLEILQIVYQQQKTMYETKTHKVENRIVSISCPYIRPIIRGKAKAPVEFGAKLDISVAEGYTRLETFSFDNYNEAKFLEQAIENYHQRTGRYPERVLADKIYRNRDNLRYCAKHHIRLSGPALGRPKKDSQPNKEQEYLDICQRVEVERKISLAKRKCGLGCLTTRLAQTTASAIALSIVVLNLRKIHRPFFQKLLFPFDFFSDIFSLRFFAFVQ